MLAILQWSLGSFAGRSPAKFRRVSALFVCVLHKSKLCEFLSVLQFNNFLDHESRFILRFLYFLSLEPRNMFRELRMCRFTASKNTI